MSGSLSQPWLRDYLVDVAETHSGDLLSVPVAPTAKKVQLVKFLTYEIEGQDNWIWAVISDIAHLVTVRFSKEAMEAYRQDPNHGHRPISSLKTAIISIKHFRPMFARVPLPRGKGMSVCEHIVLEIRVFQVVGSISAKPWGAPRDVETDEDIRSWVCGLREGNGGGNVLKLKKQERLAEQATASREFPTPQTQAMEIITHAPRYRSSSPDDPDDLGPRAPRAAQRPNKKKADPIKAHQRRWRNVVEPPEQEWSGLAEVGHVYGSPGPSGPTPTRPKTPPRRRNALDLDTSPLSSRPHTPSPRRRESAELNGFDADAPRTPSHWSPSVRGFSPRPQDSDADAEGETDEDALRNQEEDEDALCDDDADMDEDADGEHEGGTHDAYESAHEDAFGEPLSSRSPSPAQSPPATIPPSATFSPEVPLATLPNSLPAPAPTSPPTHHASQPLSSPVHGRVLVPDSTQARDGRDESLPPSSLPPDGSQWASRVDGHAPSPEWQSQPLPSDLGQSQDVRQDPAMSQSQHPIPDSSQVQSQSQGQSEGQPVAKLVHTSQPWTSPRMTSTPRVPLPLPSNHAFSGALFPAGRVLVPASDTSAATASQSQSQGKGKGEGQCQSENVSEGEGQPVREEQGVENPEVPVDESMTQPESQGLASAGVPEPASKDVPLEVQEEGAVAGNPELQAQEPREQTGRKEEGQDEMQEPSRMGAQPQPQYESQESRSAQSLSYATDSQEVPPPPPTSSQPAMPSADAPSAEPARAVDVQGPLEGVTGAAPRDALDAAEEIVAAPAENASLPTSLVLEPQPEPEPEEEDDDTADEAQAVDALVGSPVPSNEDDAMDVDVEPEIVRGSVMDEDILELPDDFCIQSPGHAPEDDAHSDAAPAEEGEMDSDDAQTDAEVRAALLAESLAMSAVEPSTPQDDDAVRAEADSSAASRILSGVKRLFGGAAPPSAPRGSHGVDVLREVADRLREAAIEREREQPSAESETMPVLGKDEEGVQPQVVQPEKTFHDAEAWKAPAFMRKQSADAVLETALQRSQKRGDDDAQTKVVQARKPGPSTSKSAPDNVAAPVSTLAVPTTKSQARSPAKSSAKSPAKRDAPHLSSASASSGAHTRPSWATTATATTNVTSGHTAPSASTLPTSTAPSSAASMKPPPAPKRRAPPDRDDAGPRPKKRRLVTTEVIEIPSSPEMERHELPPPKKKKVVRTVVPPQAQVKGKEREGSVAVQAARPPVAPPQAKSRERQAEGSSLQKAVAPPVLSEKARGKQPMRPLRFSVPEEEPVAAPPVEIGSAAGKTAANKSTIAKPATTKPTSTQTAASRPKPVYKRAPSAQPSLKPARDARATTPPPPVHALPAVPKSPRRTFSTQRRKLGGMKLDLRMRPHEMNGLLVTWQDLDAILLATGRARYKEKRAREKAKEQEQGKQGVRT